jgi:uncharacterized protein YbjT (DUF2867 family)
MHVGLLYLRVKIQNYINELSKCGNVHLATIVYLCYQLYKLFMARRVLVTGATGNVGMEVIKNLLRTPGVEVFAGVRDVEKAKQVFTGENAPRLVKFDFEDSSTFDTAFGQVDQVFLLRPPHISDIPKYFQPLVESMTASGVKEVLFLSVQGAEKSKVIPHNKIERLIEQSGLSYIFLRPSYFMQNLTTTLLADIQRKGNIILPAGNARFNWIDVLDIGESAAVLLNRFGEFSGQALEVTGLQNLSFAEAVDEMNRVLTNSIRFCNINPVRFYFFKKKEGIPPGMVLVMLLLHYLPRFQPEPAVSRLHEELTGKKPLSLRDFAEREKSILDTRG